MHFILHVYQQITELAKTNQLVAGAISLWGLSVLTYTARNIPSQVRNFVLGQVTTSLVFNNTGFYGNRYVFLAFCEWYKINKGAHLSRTLSLDATDAHGGVVMGPGYGSHIFWAEGRLFWFAKSKLESKADMGIQEIITLTTFGRSRKPFEVLVDRFKPREDADCTKIFGITNDGKWDLTAEVPKRSWSSVVLSPATKDQITTQLDQFYAMRSWYIDNGLAHKLCTLVHGKPGCGKTSMIKALAAKYGANIYSLSLNSVTDRSLPIFLSNVPTGSFVLIEDFDSYSAVKSRTEPKPDSNKVTDLFADAGGLTLSGVLNSLDGVVSLDNVVIFMTTNHIEKIDQAMLRKGRTDLIMELGYMETPEIQEYVHSAYGKAINEQFIPVAGCELQGLLLEHKQNFETFHIALTTKFGASSTTGSNISTLVNRN